MAQRHAMRPDSWTIVWLTSAVLGSLALFAVFRSARTSITQVSVGVIIALALDPLVVATKTRLRVPRRLAVLIVGLLFLVLGTSAALLLGPPARKQASQFRAELPRTVQDFERLPAIGHLVVKYDIERRVSQWVDELPAKLDDQTVVNLINRVLLNIAGMVIVGTAALAALLDGEHLIARFRRLFHNNPRRLERVDRVGRVLYGTLGQYFGGSLAVASLMGIFVLTLTLALGIPLAPLAALWAMFTDLIPQVGGFLGGAMLVVLAIAKGPVQAIIAGSAFLIYMNIENHLISPAVVGKSVDLSPPTTMLAAFIGGAVAGVPGALVATPIMGASKRLYLEFRFGWTAEPEGPGPVARLRASVARIARLLGVRSDDVVTATTGCSPVDKQGDDRTDNRSQDP